MKKIVIRAAIGLVVLLVAAFVAAGLYIDTLVKKGVEKVGPMLTKTTVNVDAVSLSLLSGGGSIKGLVVGNPEGFKSPQAIKVGNAKMSLSPGSLLSDKIVIRTIEVEGPEITFETDFKSNNLNKILANLEEATGGPSSSDDQSKKLQVDNFVISGAKMSVSLTQLGGKSVTVPLPDIHLKDLGQGPEGITAGALLKQVFTSLESSAVKAAGSAGAEIGTQAVDAAKDAASTAAGAVKKGIGGLFKSK